MWARPALAEIEHAVDVRGHADHGAGLAGDEGTGGHVYRIGPAEDGGGRPSGPDAGEAQRR
jgi:hypothetical protein